jgi:3-deoxy-D-manno-octulosonate cytidylyltransferase
MGKRETVRVAVVIPARFASTRLPGKPLADLAGKPLIQRVYERAVQVPRASVTVATDDARIAEAVRRFGGNVAMTSADCASGTDRVAEVARTLDIDVVLNIQGDEPFVEVGSLEALIAAFDDTSVEMATLARHTTEGELANPNVVKVVLDRQGNALYFSRLPVPFVRNGSQPATWAHVGVYAYRRAFLLEVASLPPTPLEKAEALEQLRVLEHGHRIRVIPTTYTGFGIDTPEDLERARQRIAASM